MLPNNEDMFTFILNPALALVSINITFRSRALASPSSIDTCLSKHKKHSKAVSEKKKKYKPKLKTPKSTWLHRMSRKKKKKEKKRPILVLFYDFLLLYLLPINFGIRRPIDILVLISNNL